MAQDFAGFGCGLPRVDGIAHEVANHFCFDGEKQQRAQRPAAQNDPQCARVECLVGGFTGGFRRSFRGLVGAFRERRGAVQKPRIGLKAAPRQVGHAGNNERDQHACPHDGTRNAEIQAFRTQQEQPDQDCVHCVVPDQSGQDAVAQHDQAHHDPDDAHFDAPGVAGLDRIDAVPESPDEGGQQNGQRFGTRQAVEKRNGKQTKDELLGSGSQQTGCQRRQPRQRGAGDIGVLDFLWRPDAELLPHDVEKYDETDATPGHGQANHAGAKEFLGPDPAPAQRHTEPKLVRLVVAVEGFAGGKRQRYDEARSQAAQRGLRHLLKQEAKVRRIGVVPEAGQGPLVNLAGEKQPRNDCAQFQRAAPADDAAAALLVQHEEGCPEEKVPGHLPGQLIDNIAGPQALKIALPLLRNLQEFLVGAGFVALHGDAQAVSGVLDLESAALPREAPVAALGPLGSAGLSGQKIVRREVHGGAGAQKCFRHGASGVLVE